MSLDVVFYSQACCQHRENNHHTHTKKNPTKHVYPCAESKVLSRVRRPTYFMKNKVYSSQLNDKIALLTSSEIRKGTMSSIYV